MMMMMLGKRVVVVVRTFDAFDLDAVERLKAEVTDSTVTTI